MKNLLIRILKLLKLYTVYTVPSSVSNKFLSLTAEKRALLGEDIIQYISPEYYATDAGKANFQELTIGREDGFRKQHAPFLVETIGLEGKEVLEIGCGVGSSTVALAEQGAKVTGIDVDAAAIEICKKRLEYFALSANVLEGNALEIDQLFPEKKWDIIIYFASLEHMTPNERKVSLKKSVDCLKIGGHLCVVGTPNRLWYMDIHTSLLPFYMWLQDDIAFDYHKYSPREKFVDEMHGKTLDKNFEEFYRWGRGVSFHEFDLAFDGPQNYTVVGSLPIFLRRYSFIQKFSYKRSLEYKYKSVLQAVGPKALHPGFYESYIDLIIEKN